MQIDDEFIRQYTADIENEVRQLMLNGRPNPNEAVVYLEQSGGTFRLVLETDNTTCLHLNDMEDTADFPWKSIGEYAANNLGIKIW